MGVRGGVRALKDRDCMVAQQPDAVLSQANPVSATLYEVLPTTRNVRLISINVAITWGVTQPTPLEVIVTIDGIPVTYTFANPVSAVNYMATNEPGSAETAQRLVAPAGDYGMSSYSSPFLREGRTIKVEARITWAVTQPTPLACRVKYAKW